MTDVTPNQERRRQVSFPGYKQITIPGLGTAVLLDPRRVYSHDIGGKLVITDRATRSTVAAIDGPQPEGHWEDGPQIPATITPSGRICICGEC